MRASGKIGVACLLVSCTWLQAQEVSHHVLRADAAVESSSNPHPFIAGHEPVHHQGLTAPPALQQVSDGNPWMHSSALGEPTTASSDGCVEWASAEFAEIPGGGLALRNF